MIGLELPSRRLSLALLLVAALILSLSSSVRSQVMTPDQEEQLQILSDPGAPKKKTEKDKVRAPFEFFKSQVTPFDVLPYVKANHWATFALELRANEEDYDGYLQTIPVMLRGMPLELIYRRDARLLKEQRARLPFQIMLNEVPKEWMIDMAHPGALRPDQSWQASLANLPPHQMLVLILSKESTTQFAAWNRMTATIPATTDREVSSDLEKDRYYRLVLPMEPDRPVALLASSHVVDDQSRNLGRSGAGRSVGLAAGSSAGLAALGWPTDPDRRRRPVFFAVS